MKKVLLINTNTEKVPYPVPPLGLCLVARSIEKSFDVTLFDAATQTEQELREMLGAVDPDYIGISIRNIDNTVMGRQVFFIPDIIKKFIVVAQSHEKATVILGGSGFSIFPEEILMATGIRYGIIGEGESTLQQLIDALETGGEPDGIPGVIYKKNHHYAVTPPAFSLAMKDVPLSRLYDLVQLDAYRERGSYPVQTKRGCVFSCIYCSYPNLEGRTYRLRNPEEIADEIEDAAERLGDILFEFVDSTFNSPAGHAEAICEEIIKKGISVRLRTMGINPKDANSSLLSLMKRAGFRQIDCTPDTASPKMLKSLKKNFSLQQLRSCADLIRRHDMPTMWFFMFGGPGETKETVRETFSFIDHYVSEKDMVFTGEGVRIYPLTEMYDLALKQGFIKAYDNLLEPVYYVSRDIGREELSSLLRREIAKRPNVVHALESAPKPEMLAEAMAIRKSQRLEEPMFRTLLRLKSKYS
ncbi:MAG: radical SAM protein [Bacteroidales bacterium]|nr:radical SAM protein [Bacteroidales bacterium]